MILDFKPGDVAYTRVSTATPLDSNEIIPVTIKSECQHNVAGLPLALFYEIDVRLMHLGKINTFYAFCSASKLFRTKAEAEFVFTLSGKISD